MITAKGAIAAAPLRLAPNGSNKQKLVCGFPSIRPLPTRRSNRPGLIACRVRFGFRGGYGRLNGGVNNLFFT